MPTTLGVPTINKVRSLITEQKDGSAAIVGKIADDRVKLRHTFYFRGADELPWVNQARLKT
jgi:hypothetical protein